jgi:sugar phosphate isomerase/epimerase
VRFAYNSNGLKRQSAPEAVELLAHLGYDGIELAFQREHLDPLQASQEQVHGLRDVLRANGLDVVCGAGVPHALGQERFEPSLFHPDAAGRGLRRRFLQASLAVAAELGSPLLVFCTGTLRPNVDRATAWEWLTDGIAETCAHAGELGLSVALEPEPGHLVETIDDYRRLRDQIGLPEKDHLGITLDVGHLHCTENRSPQTHLKSLLQEGQLLHVQIDDMRDRRHEHLPLGEGEIDFRPVMCTLVDGNYAGLVSVELSQHSDRAAEMAARSLAFLRALSTR